MLDKGFTVPIRGNRESRKALEKSGKKECRKTNAALVCVAGRGGKVRSMGVDGMLVPWVLMMANGQAWLFSSMGGGSCQPCYTEPCVKCQP